MVVERYDEGRLGVVEFATLNRGKNSRSTSASRLAHHRALRGEATYAAIC